MFLVASRPVWVALAELVLLISGSEGSAFPPEIAQVWPSTNL